MTCRSALGPVYNFRPQELQGCNLQRRQRFHPWYWPHSDNRLSGPIQAYAARTGRLIVIYR
jgi:hypothetical protein